jgi:hypothetical protein
MTRTIATRRDPGPPESASWDRSAKREGENDGQEDLGELGLTERRCTRIPTIQEAMAKNGSPPPEFSTPQRRGIATALRVIGEQL